MKHKANVRSRIDIDDPELRKLVIEIKRRDPRSRTITQALRNAAVSYLKELTAEAQS